MWTKYFFLVFYTSIQILSRTKIVRKYCYNNELMLSFCLVTGSGMPSSARSSHTGVSRFWVCHNGASG